MSFTIKLVLASDPNVFIIVSNVVHVDFDKYDEFDPGFLNFELPDDMHLVYEAELWKIVSIW